MGLQMKNEIDQKRELLDHPNFDAAVWGRHYWFFLHTVAETYPEYPNDITKRKYYDLIMNMPLFIPNEKMGNNFASMLDKYPVTPYLVCRDSFRRWMNFIHNKINFHLGKEEVALDEGISKYYQLYNDNTGISKYIPFCKKNQTLINVGIIGMLLGTIYVISTLD
jgi:hypothetical protein